MNAAARIILKHRARLLRYETKMASRAERAFAHTLPRLIKALRAGAKLEELEAILADAPEWVRKKLRQQLYKLAVAEHEFTVDALARIAPKLIVAAPANEAVFDKPHAIYLELGKEQTRELVTGYKQTGKSKGLAWDDSLTAIVQRQLAEVSRAIAAGGSEDDIVSRVRVRVKIAAREAKRLVRSEVQRVATASSEVAYADNADLVEAMRFTAVLDTTTCPTCGDLDGNVYAMGDERPELPIHNYCRCVYLPVFKGESRKRERQTWKNFVEDLDQDELAEIFGKRKAAEYTVAELLDQQREAKLGEIDPSAARHALKAQQLADFATGKQPIIRKERDPISVRKEELALAEFIRANNQTAYPIHVRLNELEPEQIAALRSRTEQLVVKYGPANINEVISNKAIADESAFIYAYTAGSSVFINPDYMRDNAEALKRAYKYDPGYHAGEPIIEDIYTHEYGHTLYGMLSPEEEQQVKEAYEKYVVGVPELRMRRVLSGYAQVNEREMFAELFLKDARGEKLPEWGEKLFSDLEVRKPSVRLQPLAAYAQIDEPDASRPRLGSEPPIVKQPKFSIDADTNYYRIKNAEYRTWTEPGKKDPTKFVNKRELVSPSVWVYKGKPVSEAKRLTLEKLVEPAWREARVSAEPDAKLVAQGLDRVGKIQPRYSQAHIDQAYQDKMARQVEFTKALPGMELVFEQDASSGKDVARVMQIEALTGIRNGSDADTKAQHKAYGLTTLLNRHVDVQDARTLHFKFVAKWGAEYESYVEAPRDLVAWVEQQKAKTKKDEKLWPQVNAAKMNKYLKTISDDKFTIKDFRNHHSTRIVLDYIQPFIGKKLSAVEFAAIQKAACENAGKFLSHDWKEDLQTYCNPAVWELLTLDVAASDEGGKGKKKTVKK